MADLEELALDNPALEEPALEEPALLAAAHRRQGTQVPIWFMRQAGRSLPEYRELRAGTDMLASCFDPEMVVEITLQPVRRHGVDAAIFFSDIMVPLKAAGVGVEIASGVGPVVAEPIRNGADLDRVPPLHPDQLDAIAEAVHGLVDNLGQTPLIGFAGAPFTLASYLIEGRPSKDHAMAKALMVGAPELWHDLCARLAQISSTFLSVQVANGARAVQLFDSWAGSLSRADYDTFCRPHSMAALAEIPEGIPVIHFGVGTAELLPSMAFDRVDVIGVDWRTPLNEATARVPGRAVQGNLDPALLGAPWPVLADRMRDVIRGGASAPGHILNLGHGVPPTTDPTVLTRLVELAHTEGPQLRAEGTVTKGR